MSAADVLKRNHVSSYALAIHKYFCLIQMEEITLKNKALEPAKCKCAVQQPKIVQILLVSFVFSQSITFSEIRQITIF